MLRIDHSKVICYNGYVSKAANLFLYCYHTPTNNIKLPSAIRKLEDENQDVIIDLNELQDCITHTIKRSCLIETVHYRYYISDEVLKDTNE
jgi:hypothetical protein